MKLLIPALIGLGLCSAGRIRRAGHASGVHYSDNFQAAITANAAKIGATAQAADAELMASMASLDASALALLDVQNYQEGLTEAQMETCDDAFAASYELRFPVSGLAFNYVMSEMSFDYIFGYISYEEWMLFKTSLVACHTALNAGNELATTLSTGMALVTPYGVGVSMDLDWTLWTNPMALAEPAITLTAADKMSKFIGYKLELIGLITNTVYHDFVGVVPPSSAVSTINDLEETWNFADVTAFYTALAEAEKLNAIGYTNNLALFRSNEDATYGALGYDADSDPTLTAVKALGAQYDTLTAVWNAEVDAIESSGGKLSVGIALVLVMLVQLF